VCTWLLLLHQVGRLDDQGAHLASKGAQVSRISLPSFSWRSDSTDWFADDHHQGSALSLDATS
jgi:hypothetical protein